MKKIISIILTTMLLLSVCLIPITSQAESATDNYIITGTTLDWYYTGDTIDLIIQSSETSGNCNYPDNISTTLRVIPSLPLTLIAVADLTNGELGQINYAPEIINSMRDEYIFIFENDLSLSDVHYAGNILKLTFKADPKAVTATNLASFRVAYETVNFNLITEEENVWTEYLITPCKIGDINRDGLITTIDRIVLSRYLADIELGISSYSTEAMDIDRDGKVTSADRIILSRYLANWKGYDTYFNK